jgi:hypothetical protein
MDLIEDITEFLPKYPNIFQDSDDLFNPYDNDFYENIYNKKEFYDEKLDKIEEFPDEVGGLLKHQKIIARFFSSHTNYDQLLLVHEMGTGKGCSAIGAIEQIKADGGFRGALYLAKGDALLNNFMNELIFKCTDGRYIPEDYENLTKLEKVHRKKKALKEYYRFNTFETFAKYIKNSSDSNLQKEYNNFVIVIDEVHNLRIQDKISGLNIYEQFFRFLHTIEGCKILLMSGTPMKDDVKEISSVMNLILPTKNDGKGYLPVGDDFTKEFFTQSESIYTVKPDKIKELKKVFKGRVSFLHAMESNVKKEYKGLLMGTLKYFKVVADKMSTFQTEVYQEAYKLDKEGDKEGVYSNSRQAILFVYPDKSFGKPGFDKYVKRSKSNNFFIDDNGKRKSLITFSLSKELKDEIKGISDEQSLKKLEKFSSKYATTVRNILRAKEQGKCVFIYNEFVYGGGLILLGLILELFGFSKCTGKEKNNDERPRYASLTNVTSTTTQIRDIVNRFNEKDNVHGKIINIIMGSRKISEGFSFQNIQIEDIQTPWFNYSETSQAIARGIRLGSHRKLIESGLTNPVVEIYQRVSIPKIGKSVDLEMYEISEDKDIGIKGVERIIKESAFDCGLTYKRNFVLNKNGERECEYMDCIYTCDGISSYDIQDKYLDYTTFQLYYNNQNIDKIIEFVKNIFRKVFSIDLETIKTLFEDENQYYTDFDIISALKKIIDTNTVIVNKYGFFSYIKEANNIYFLVDNLSLKGKVASEYYTEYPHVTIPDQTFSKIIDPIYYKSLPKIIKEIFSIEKTSELRKLISKLPSEIVEFIIEQSLIAERQNIQTNKDQRKMILEYFKSFYKEIDGTLISSYLYKQEEVLRCLSNDEWDDCDEDSKEKYLESQRQQIVDLENNPYGYYGQKNPDNDKFCIRDVSNKNKETQKHKKTSGLVCSTWKLPALYDMVINKVKIPLPDETEVRKYLVKFIENTNRKRTVATRLKIPSFQDTEAIWKLIKEFKNINTMFDDVKNNLTADDMIRILYWGTKTKDDICVDIENWFEKENLLVSDTGCGKGDKKKPNT